ncbi:exopolysaccharide biosynthesis polyprenyl glycosylphosphotransferase [Metabacillus fastidiosus]|uniref:exopolysaccharide biosynthesis polyprenyl glycosylphosphotransferase n=1 Tax=Metabacillus fastidiosus TaxID=1458 RepID=UPI003D28BECB
MAVNRAESTAYENYQPNPNPYPRVAAVIPRETVYNLALKRIFDLIFATIGLIIAAPIILITMLIIRLESPGAAVFYQERLGLKGKSFNVIKLRSMRTDAEKNGAQWASKNDPRVTKVGAFIRKTRIDELPQLVNVIKGEMSIIGPRPERPQFTEDFDREIPGFKMRLAVRPGVTGWAQVNGGYDITPKEKLAYDLYYIKNMGLLLDLTTAFKTIKVIFTGEGAR